MLNMLSTLMKGARAQAEEKITGHFAIDLINQKIREAEAGLSAAKNTLASLIIRRRQEERALHELTSRKSDLEERTKQALADGKTKLANEAAAAIADLENEQTVRKQTLEGLTGRVERMRLSIEKAARRIVALRQSAITARAIDAERKAQSRLLRSLQSNDAIAEAEVLIARVSEQDDPLEQSEVLSEIEDHLSHENICEKMANAGYGSKTRVTAADVLERLVKNNPSGKYSQNQKGKDS